MMRVEVEEMAKPKTGATQINFELPPELLDRLKAFAEERGQSLKYVMQRALIRHMDSPPPIAPDPPLPACEPDPPKPAPRGKKSAKR
jgi:hypothetical protein